RRQLEEWLASKGKTYKRPPMMLLQKQPVKLSCRSIREKEKPRDPEQLSQERIKSLLTECLKLVEEGAQAEDIWALLARVPQAEKFSTFWICRAKLLARAGPFDVTGLYKAAVCAGAAPLQELREVVLDILKATDQAPGGMKRKQAVPWDPATPHPSERQQEVVTPCPATGRSMSSLPPSIKLQVTSASRPKEPQGGPELKLLTPVRRSLRIERVGGRYPEMLKAHDPVVASLSEALETEEEEAREEAAARFFFRKNKALP
ncbi:CKP2L protein, partial [Upupa epops]|nr:CKP2L protein [Upupa epops]